MPCLVEIPERPDHFTKAKGGGANLRENGSSGQAGRSGGMGNCSHNVMYERIIILKDSRKYLLTSNMFLQ